MINFLKTAALNLLGLCLLAAITCAIVMAIYILLKMWKENNKK